MKTLMTVLLSALVSCMGAPDTMDTPADATAIPPTDSPPVTPPDVPALDAAVPPVMSVIIPPLGGTVAITGRSFTIRQGAPTLRGSVWTMQTPPQFDELVCTISIAPGTRITHLVWSVNPEVPVAFVTFNFRLVRVSPEGQQENFLARLNYSGIDYTGAYQLIDSANNGAYVTEQGFKYELSITVATVGAYEPPPLFDGVTLTYE